MRSLLSVEPSASALERLRMEEFFKDLYYDFVSAPDDAGIRRAYIDLVGIYTRILRETTNWLCEDGRTGAPVGQLIAAAANVAETVTIVTFNHDLVIENEIFKRARLRSRWCIEQGYGAIATSMTTLRSGVPGADFPRHGTACDHAHPVTVLKLHGSLNWVVRLRGVAPTAGQLSGSSQRPVFLSRRREIIARLRYTTRRRGPGRTSWHTWPLIVPPVYAKQMLLQSMKPAWDDARSALAQCDRAVFFGYSLPTLDVEAEKLFQRALAANHGLAFVDVVNPDPRSASRFASLLPTKPTRWYPGLSEFIADRPFA